MSTVLLLDKHEQKLSKFYFAKNLPRSILTCGIIINLIQDNDFQKILVIKTLLDPTVTLYLAHLVKLLVIVSKSCGFTPRQSHY